MTNQQKGVQQDTAYRAVVVNDHIMYSCPTNFFFVEANITYLRMRISADRAPAVVTRQWRLFEESAVRL